MSKNHRAYLDARNHGFKTRKKYTNMTRAWNLEDAYISPGEILKAKESTTRTD
jgi:hypothetical protein